MNNITILVNGEPKITNCGISNSVLVRVEQVGENIMPNKPVYVRLFDGDSISVKVEKVKKPILGLVPQWVRLEEREQEIKEAIQRFDEANEEVPENWIKELRTVQKQLAGIEVEV